MSSNLPTRIALIRLPRMLRDILRDVVTAQEDMEIVGEYEEGARLVDVVNACDPDFLITGSDHAFSMGIYHLLESRPALRVLEVTMDGRDAFLCDVRPHGTPLGQASPQKLLNVIRSSGRRERDA